MWLSPSLALKNVVASSPFFMAEPVTPPAPSPAPVVTPPAPTAPAAPPAKTGEETEVPKTWDEIFKHPRFEQLNQKAKDAQAALDAKAKADADAEQARQIEQGKHLDVIKSLEPFKARATELETALNTVIEAEIASIPKERQSLVPDLSPEKKLQWITANRAILMGDTQKKNVNHPTNPADGSPSGGNNETFTQAQIKDPVFYEKNRDAIIAALKDGRVKD